MNEAREERKKPFREEFAEKIIGLIGRERLRKAREAQMDNEHQEPPTAVSTSPPDLDEEIRAKINAARTAARAGWQRMQAAAEAERQNQACNTNGLSHKE